MAITPLEISGKDIPFLARILAVVDSFDAMTNDRPYRLAMSIDKAVEELVKNKNTKCDADIVEALIKII